MKAIVTTGWGLNAKLTLTETDAPQRQLQREQGENRQQQAGCEEKTPTLHRLIVSRSSGVRQTAASGSLC